MDKESGKTDSPARGAGGAGRIAVAFVAVALVLLLLPFAGMLWARTDATSENRELAAAPALVDEDGAFNVGVLADLGSYFDDHFAYRNELVAANAAVRGLFGVSSTDQVVVGSDGWLYYGGTLPDYLGQLRLSDRALGNIAHNLALMQGYARGRGAAFVFTIAPNKNTLYPAHMPYYYLRSEEPRNWDRLKPLLESEGVAYLDLFELIGGADGELYYLRDSHWTNRGAFLAANALLGALGREQLAAGDGDWLARDDWVGDVEAMLHPVGQRAEAAEYLAGVNDGPGLSGTLWRYTAGDDVTNDSIETAGPGAGTLLMYRDSFGNALLPYMSSAFSKTVFSKLVPYYAGEIDAAGADCVVVERAERHLDYLAHEPAIMPAPLLEGVAVPGPGELDEGTTLERGENGPYAVISGVLGPDSRSEDCRIAVAVTGASGETSVYEAFRVSVGEQRSDAHWDLAAVDDYGYKAYLDTRDIDLEGATITAFAF